MMSIPPFPPISAGTPYHSPYPPRRNAPVHDPPRRKVPGWVVLVVSVTVGICLLLGPAVAAITLIRDRSSTSLAQTLPASVGQALVINNVTVTLMSATVVSIAPPFGVGEDVPGVKFSLHFWNQFTSEQTVSTQTWSLIADNGAKSYPVYRSAGTLAVLAPNQTQDAQYTIQMSIGDYGPYTLQTDFTTSQGQPLAWTFSG